MGSHRAMDLNRHEVPKHHQERTWAIYGKSVPQLLLERAAARPESVALRYKDVGLYQEVTWRKYREDVEVFALGLISLGVAPRDRIAIMGDPCFEYFVADMAGLTVGAITYVTSATTGAPKAAMITHRDVMVGMVNTYLQGYPELEIGEHRIISHLPLAHLVERSMSMCLMLIADVIPHIGEETENLRETLVEVEPTFFHAVPRVWEKLASQILVNIDRSTLLKRLAYKAAMSVGQHHARMCWQKRRHPLWLAAGYALARALVFKPMLMKVGLQKLHSALTAGAPIPHPIQALWQIWGVNLRNLYGITEHTLVLCQSGPFPEPGDAGLPLYPKEVRLGIDGEILVRGPGMFAGYWKNEAATNEVIRDGWFYTGDVAELTRAGHFRIIDRKKDIMVTAGGKNIAPSEIENLLKTSSFISEAILFADGRKFPSALIEIDFDTVADWARQHGVLYTGFTSLSQHPRVGELIAQEIEKVNAQLAR